MSGEPPAPRGREREIAALLDLLDQARRGVGAFVLIEGEGGIGKTHLAGALLAAAADRGVQTRAGQANQFERHRPFAAIADSLAISPASADERSRHAAQLLAGLNVPARREQPAWAASLHDSGELELALDEILLDVLEDLCARSPALLVIEDLHWADSASLGFVGRLLRRVEQLGTLVLCTARPSPRPAELERVVHAAREHGATLLTLGPLPASEITAIATSLLGATPGRNLQRKLAACGGNPLFARTLLDALRSDEAIAQSADGTVEVADERAPEALGLTVLGWLASLAPQTVDTLQMASVLGSRFTLADLAIVTRRGAAELWGALRDALSTGALVESEQHLGFRHELVRDALYEDLPGTVRAALHGEFASALAEAGAAPSAVAEHLLRGAPHADRDSVDWIVRAAREAAPQSAATAAELLAAAVEMTDEHDPERAAMRAELGLTLIAAGRRIEGEDICREVLAGAEATPAEGALRLALANSLMERGQALEAVAEAASAAAATGVTPGDRAEALSWTVMAPLLGGDLEGAERAAAEALAYAEQADAAAATGLLLTRLAHIAFSRGEFERQAQLTARAVAVVERDGGRDALHASHAHLNHALAQTDCDDPRAGLASIDEARRLYAELGMEEDIRNSHHYACWPLIVAGDWDDALAEIETTVALSDEAGISWVVDVLALRAVMLVRRDETAAALAPLTRAEAARAQGAPEFRAGIVTWARALLDESDGRSDAVEPLWDAWIAAGAAKAYGNQRMIAADLARMLAARGETERVARLAADMEELARRNRELTTVQALACHCRALLHGDGDGLERACELYGRDIRPEERAMLLEAAAAARAREGERDRARTLADRALALHDELGAARESARARARLRDAGLRPARRGSRAREQTGWGSLTPSELRVAELAAEGMSNPQIAERLVVSRHTVATHVSHILLKLDLRSRYELAAARPAAAEIAR